MTIINIINFIRGVEPREDVDLHEPVRQQLQLLEEHNMTGTFLMQYDAMIDEQFVSMLQNTRHEIGCWLEIVEPLCKEAGIPWRGRFPWDWHAHVGFSVGYTPDERKILIDTLMAKFKELFGTYPRSVGSWMIDAVSLDYMATKYGVIASCNCKDQWGTDGYTLWGGYYGQAYYPSKTNAYAPAQHVENQIPIPIFKMLGSDPIYQYDTGLSLKEGATRWQNVITLEPVYHQNGGGDKAWTKWFFEHVLTGTCCLTFRYAQVGQENSFGWPAMAEGLQDQFNHLTKMRDQGILQVETLADSATAFSAQYPTTPNAAITALNDWKDEGRQSVWFCSKRYRTNLFREGKKLWFRDLMLFDDAYTERYINAVCDNPEMVYDNLPIMDGNRWSGNDIRAGLYFNIDVEDIQVAEKETELEITVTATEGEVVLRLSEDTIAMTTNIADLRIEFIWGKSTEMDSATVGEKSLQLVHEEFTYGIQLTSGKMQGMQMIPEEGSLTIRLA